MLVHVILNFDDVLFPTRSLTSFYHHERSDFVLPVPVQEQIDHLDGLIHRVLAQHLNYTRFRLLTRAPLTWLHTCLKLMPRLRRYVDWRYVDVVLYGDTTRHQQTYETLLKDRLYDVYLFLGYSVDEEATFPTALRSARTRIRVLQFAHYPTVASLLYQWECMNAIVNGFLTSNEPLLRQQFVVPEDCQQTYATPGWYGDRRHDATTRGTDAEVASTVVSTSVTPLSPTRTIPLPEPSLRHPAPAALTVPNKVSPPLLPTHRYHSLDKTLVLVPTLDLSNGMN